jgi:DNA-binding transcriptional MerR regulator
MREGRARYYGPREVARMTLILRGRRFGFSLEEIRQWLELYDADPEGKTQRDAWLASRTGNSTSWLRAGSNWTRSSPN